MSEFTQCNYCSLKEIRAQAKRDHGVVMFRNGWRGGVDVFVVPRGVKIPAGGLPDKSPLRKKYFAAWMQEIGSSCTC